MNLSFALLFLGVGLTSPGDTLLEVRAGDQLLMHDLNGDVVVDVWDRSYLQAEAYLEDGTSISFHRRGSRIQTSLSGRRSRGDVEIRVRVPTWLALEVTGRDLSVAVRGLEAELSIHTLYGDVVLEDLAGVVQVYATDGEVDAVGLTGPARLRTGDADLTVRDSYGSLELETVDGEVHLEGIVSPEVSVRTTDGEIDFEGSFRPGGDYGFFSHGGNITLRLESPLNLEARILAYGGEFGSDFPVRATAFRSGEGMQFTMGSGGSTLTVESFRGDVRFRDGGVPLMEANHITIANQERGAGR